MKVLSKCALLELACKIQSIRDINELVHFFGMNLFDIDVRLGVDPR